MKRIQPLLANEAQFVASDFAFPAGWKGRWIARPLVAFLYWAFGWLTGLAVRTLPDHGKALEEAGFTLKQKRPLLGGILVGEMWQWRKRL